MQTLIRLLLKEQSDQCLHCLPFHLINLTHGLIVNLRTSNCRVNRYTSRGNNSAIFIFTSLLKWGQLSKGGICSSRSKFFPLSADTTSKEFHCKEVSVTLCKNGGVSELIQRQDLGLKSHPKDRRRVGSILQSLDFKNGGETRRCT